LRPVVTAGNVQDMASAADIIDQLGKPAEVAAKIGVDPVVVRMWKHRNKLPRTMWPELLQAYPSITMDALLKTERQAA
jgi:hypothetical protein